MVKSKSKFNIKKPEPHSIMALVVIALSVLTTGAIASAQISDMSRIKSAQSVETSKVSTETQKPAVEPEKKVIEKPVEKTEELKKEAPKVDPNGCEAKGMWYRADNNECIPKTAQSAVSAPQTRSTGGGSGSCQAEISKYDWNHSVATAVMLAESGGSTSTVNDNPATGDYSIGCFQINIYGANAASRPSEAALKDAATNVAFAYRIYVGNGHSFIGQWGVCRSKVSCY